MSKTYLIETVSTFVHGYVVEMDDDADPKEIAEQVIDEAEWKNGVQEFYQYHTGEVFDQCIPTSLEQAPRIFRAKNEYLSHLTDEEITKRFMIDKRKKETA